MAVSVQIEIPNMEDLLRKLNALPSLVVGKDSIMENAVFEASKVVLARAIELAPDSKKNPKGDSRRLQSKKSRGIWTAKLRDTVRQKTINYKTMAWAVVGPKHPEGNMAHFMQEKPRRHVLWGKASAVKSFRDTRNWITRAFDETKSQQMSAIETSLRADIDKVMKL